jgi:hypothetical protein
MRDDMTPHLFATSFGRDTISNLGLNCVITKLIIFFKICNEKR